MAPNGRKCALLRLLYALYTSFHVASATIASPDLIAAWTGRRLTGCCGMRWSGLSVGETAPLAEWHFEAIQASNRQDDEKYRTVPAYRWYRSGSAADSTQEIPYERQSQ